MNAKNGALVQLRAFLAQGEFQANDRLPAERVLCQELGVSRAELRKAFALLEAEGAIWRHVGRGTFVGDGAADPVIQSVNDIAKRTPPREVMQARRLIEPMMAREAALHASGEQMDQLRSICRKARRAQTWREYEALDNQFHRLIADATQNRPLLAIFDHLNALRRTVAWGRLRREYEVPPSDHHSFAEHEAILGAIIDRDGSMAQEKMQQHLSSVSRHLFEE